ncbi:MAG TPA: TonB-dependent receptor [Chitinophagaceae bacterium]|nr:TonB-dependent receptor [Chitinophagaceae bacterium]
MMRSLKKAGLCLLLLVATGSFHLLFAQGKQIIGTVTASDTKLGSSGVTVTVKGTSTATTTDAQGAYKLTVPSNARTLVFSSATFVTYEAAINGRTTIDVEMTPDVKTIEDVVVVGYSAIKRKDLTGSVSSISSKQLKDFPLSSAAEALQGKLAGVQLTTTEGAPGADIIVRVRGGGSITQDNSPLYIVDGVQVENALSVLSPQDIASIDVLKDASTTAIYGARGANGVVIITTKGGRNGKTQVTYNGSVGYRQLSKFQDVMQPYNFVLWQYERSRGSSLDSASFAQTYGTYWDTLAAYKNAPFVNWQEEVFGRKAKFQQHNVAVSGGGANTTFNLSFTANKEEGIQIESGFDRKMVNFKIDHKATEKLRVGFTARYLDQRIEGSGTTNSGTRTTNRLRHTINYRPFELPRPGYGIDDFDEAYYLASAGATNPVILTKAEYRRQYTKAVYLTGYLSYNIIKNLTFRSTVGFDNAAVRTDLFYSKITGTARNAASLPVASIGQQNNYTISNSNTLQYSVNNYKKHHDFSVLAGEEVVDVRSKQNTIETRYFPADITPDKALANMGLGTAPSGSSQPLPTSFEQPPARIASFFGRISYAYDDKYLVNFNLRNDRSSKFSAENASETFPSGSFAWRFSKEKFMDKTSWLNDGKIRFGFGSVGNNRIDNLLYLQLYGVTGQYAFNHSILPGFAPSALANPDLQWEKNTTKNLGLDLAMFKNRVQLSIDVYKNSAKNLLLKVAIPPTTGYAEQLKNVGATSNRGVEVQINATPIQKKDFTWNSNFNIAFNKNRVESLGGLQSQTKNSGWQGTDGVDDYLVKVGEPVGLMYGFVTDGFYKVEDFNYNAATATYTIKPGIAVNGIYGSAQPGSLKWKDLNNDGAITADGDRQVIGNANPDFTGGWTNQFSYKGIDLSVFVNFVVGNDIYNANKIEWTDGAFANLNMLDDMNQRFTYINASGVRITDPTELAKLNAGATIWTPVRVQRWWLHSWAIEDGSYLRFNNITLGYTLPSSIMNKIKLSSIRFYGTVNNLATITNYSGYDPDVTARRTDPLTPGVDFAAYPRARTWVFGVNVTF